MLALYDPGCFWVCMPDLHTLALLRNLQVRPGVGILDGSIPLLQERLHHPLQESQLGTPRDH